MQIQVRDTRSDKRVSLRDAVLKPLTPKGGLYTVDDWAPLQVQQTPADLSKLSYPELATAVLTPWFRGWLEVDELLAMAEAAWGDFGPDQIDPADPTDRAYPAPQRKLRDNLSVLELFHGPTLAFKDFGLRFLAQLFEREMRAIKQQGRVLVATSGDTGAAAVHAFAGQENLDIVVLFPPSISKEQRAQMTRSVASNVHCLEVIGIFDQCQHMVKLALTGDSGNRIRLGVNSVNIGRLLAQMVYYWWAWLSAGAPPEGLSFVVSSGNFGNALSCWMAVQCGLPVHRLIVATNKNAALARFFSDLQSPDAKKWPTVRTPSSAMDISVPSNLERLQFELLPKGELITTSTDMTANHYAPQKVSDMRSLFASDSCNREETYRSMRHWYEKRGWMPDPHTAVGLHVAKKLAQEGERMIVVSTAHASKFIAEVEIAMDPGRYRHLTRPMITPGSVESEASRPARERCLAGLMESGLGEKQLGYRRIIPDRFDFEEYLASLP